MSNFLRKAFPGLVLARHAVICIANCCCDSSCASGLLAWMQVKVMIHERDKLMVKRLRECNGKVVGVVGMAHMDGIERLWKELES